MPQWARDSVLSSYGESAEGFLELAGAKRQEVLRESVRHFRERTDLPSWEVADYQPIPLGGIHPNDLLIAAPTHLDEEPWTELLGRSASIPIEVDGMTVTYVVQRRFDPGVSRLLEAPVVSYSEGLVAIAHSREPRQGVSVLSVDDRGVQEVLVLPNLEPSPPVDFPDRRRRFSGYADALVGWQEAQKVYLPIERAEHVEPPGLERDDDSYALSSSRWEALTLGEPTTTRPVDTELPAGSERILGPDTIFLRPRNGGGGGWDGPDERENPPRPGTGAGTHTTGTAVLSGGVSAIIGISRSEGNTGQSGWGPEQTSAPSYGSCSHYNARDECKNCCVTVFTWGISIVLGAGIACHSASGFWCLPCHFVCGFVEGAAITILVLAKDDCQKNCDIAVTW